MYIYIYIGGRDLSIPAYFIPAHVDGAWSKIMGCCCSAALERTPPNWKLTDRPGFKMAFLRNKNYTSVTLTRICVDS